jgi:beta-N-acetylhexosaminidase
MSFWSKEYKITRILIIITLLLFLLNVPGKEFVWVDYPHNIEYDEDTNTLDFSTLTLKQKIAQMLILYAKEDNIPRFQNMFIGGVYLDARETKEDFIDDVNKFQKNAIIPFFISVDMEGCINPFENFYLVPTFREIESDEKAYQIGSEVGSFLQGVGVTMNFAPVIDLEDKIFNCRNFEGTPEEIAQRANSYLNGLQEQGVMAVAKHYPGKTLANNDPHLEITSAIITEDDLIPFQEVMQNNVSAVMVSHLIVEGMVNSENKPAVLSQKVINDLKEGYDGLIITDEIGMLGLATYYSSAYVNQLFTDLYNSGSNMILNFDRNPLNILHLINAVEEAVKKGELSEDKIDYSVRKILEAKGINIIN